MSPSQGFGWTEEETFPQFPVLLLGASLRCMMHKFWETCMLASNVARLVLKRVTINWRAPPLTFNNFSTIA